MESNCVVCNVLFSSPRGRKTCGGRCRSSYKYKLALTAGTIVKRKVNPSSFERKRKIKQLLLNLKGKSCGKCGYRKCNQALEFHHVSGEKESTVAKLIGLKLETIKKELDKCILLCSNCHRIEHSFLKLDGQDYQHKLRKFLQEKSGNSCSNCGCSDPNTFTFHHIDPKEKAFNISKAVASRWDINKVVPEINKCAMLCSNCHREHHSGLVVNMNKVKLTQEDINHFLDKYGKNKKCKYCKINFKTTQMTKFCSDTCSVEYKQEQLLRKEKIEFNRIIKKEEISQRLTMKKIVSFNREEKVSKCENKRVIDINVLKNEYINSGFSLSETGKNLRISGNAVKKRLKKHFLKEWTEFQLKKKELIKINCKFCKSPIQKYSKLKDYNRQRFCSDKCRNQVILRYVYDPKIIITAYKKHKYNVSKTAEDVKINRKCLRKWLIKHNLFKSKK